MNLVFPADATKTEKVIHIFFLAWLFLGIHGMYSGFVATGSVSTACLYVAAPIGLVLFFFLGRRLMDLSSSVSGTKRNPLKQFLLLLLALPLTYGVAWVGLAFGLTSAATQLVGTPFSASYVVTAKGDGRFHLRFGACSDHKIHLRSVDGTWQTSLCGDKESWGRIGVGELVVGRGRQSALGTLVETIEPNG